MARYLLASIAMVAMLSACGTDPSTEPARATETSAATSLQTESSGSPLEDSLGFASEPERRRYQLISAQRDADARVVRCMERAGFFYAVRPAEEVFRSGASVGDGSRAWSQANGLGITSSFIQALAQTATAPADATDTNLSYIASLTPAQQADYDLALVVR